LSATRAPSPPFFRPPPPPPPPSPGPTCTLLKECVQMIDDLKQSNFEYTISELRFTNSILAGKMTECKEEDEDKPFKCSHCKEVCKVI